MMLSTVRGVVDYFCRLYKSLCTHPDGIRIRIELKGDSDMLEDTLQGKFHPDFLEKEEGRGYLGEEKTVPCPCVLCAMKREKGVGGYKKGGDPCICVLCVARAKVKQGEGNFGQKKGVSCPCCRVWKISVEGGQDYFGKETRVQCTCCNELRVARVGVRKNPGLKVVGRCSTMKSAERIIVKGVKRGA